MKETFDNYTFGFELETQATEGLSRFTYNDFNLSKTEARALGEKWKLDSDKVEVTIDRSVTGFEFRTIGGLSQEDFFSCARQVFSLSHDINEFCSFQIHIGLPSGEVASKKDFRRQQYAMTRNLLLLVNSFPDYLKKRWHCPGFFYFAPRLEKKGSKRCSISFHQQGTWEFRFFGNVKTLAEATQCFSIMQELFASRNTVPIVRTKNFVDFANFQLYYLSSCLSEPKAQNSLLGLSEEEWLELYQKEERL